jgi:hypothetical protein
MSYLAYRRRRSRGICYAVFNPSVSASMSEVEVTRAYKNMMDKYMTIRFVKAESVDLDH